MKKDFFTLFIMLLFIGFANAQDVSDCEDININKRVDGMTGEVSYSYSGDDVFFVKRGDFGGVFFYFDNMGSPGAMTGFKIKFEDEEILSFDRERSSVSVPSRIVFRNFPYRHTITLSDPTLIQKISSKNIVLIQLSGLYERKIKKPDDLRIAVDCILNQ